MSEISIEEARALERNQWSEEQFQAAVLEQVLGRGWRGIHLKGAYTGLEHKKGPRKGKPMFITPYSGRAGFPDTVAMILTIPARGIAWELKVKNKQATPDQLAWLTHFRAMGFNAGVFRPSDWNWMMAFLDDIDLSKGYRLHPSRAKGFAGEAGPVEG